MTIDTRRQRWRRAKELFDAAAALGPEERSRALERSCGDDETLRREVESLLDAHAQAGDFLEVPAASASLGGEWNLEGRRFGPYEVGARIGSGGMGDVYRARDTRLGRIVALKVCAARLAGRANLREQFTREAKAISALHHPRICVLHDVGQHESIDFLVMEYVDGEPITDYCARHRLPVNRRLAMFRTVCEAVHYAHQNLVVHRDLKPSNILVGADGEPKLLDFGIAKLLAPVDADAPAHTVVSALTPEYASPEQVRGETVTTATDVYSLGVVLYELLAGRRPFALRAGSLEDIVQTVCDTDPAPPSAAVRAATPTSPSASRAANELRGDLDTIVLKALRKEPERRYLSAQELSDDIGRYLERKPVAARGDARAYRLAKFLARHRPAAAVCALFVGFLLGSMALIVKQSQIAEMERQRAERRFADVRKLAGSLLFEFHDSIESLPGSTRARELVMKRAVQYLDSLAAESANDPTLRAELASAYHRVAEVQGGIRQANLGDVTGALASYRKALALQEDLLRQHPDDRAMQRAMGRTVLGIGDIQLHKRDLSAALGSVRRFMSIAEARAAAVPGSRDAQRDVAIAHARIAEIMWQLDDRPGSDQHLQRAIAILKPLAADAADLDSRRALARSYKKAGLQRALAADRVTSLAMLDEAVRLNEALAAAAPMNTTARNEVAMSHMDLGRARLWTDDPRQALASLRRAESITASMVATDASNVQVRWLHGLELNLIGVALRQLNRGPAAVAAHERALSLLEKVAREDPHNETYQYNVANTFQLIADAHVAIVRSTQSSVGRREVWGQARDWYARSANRFDAMRRRGTLTGIVVKDAEHVTARLALCDRELRGATSPD